MINVCIKTHVYTVAELSSEECYRAVREFRGFLPSYSTLSLFYIFNFVFQLFFCLSVASFDDDEIAVKYSSYSVVKSRWYLSTKCIEVPCSLCYKYVFTWRSYVTLLNFHLCEVWSFGFQQWGVLRLLKVFWECDFCSLVPGSLFVPCSI